MSLVPDRLRGLAELIRPQENYPWRPGLPVPALPICQQLTSLHYREACARPPPQRPRRDGGTDYLGWTTSAAAQPGEAPQEPPATTASPTYGNPSPCRLIPALNNVHSRAWQPTTDQSGAPSVFPGSKSDRPRASPPLQDGAK